MFIASASRFLFSIQKLNEARSQRKPSYQFSLCFSFFFYFFFYGGRASTRVLREQTVRSYTRRDIINVEGCGKGKTLGDNSEGYAFNIKFSS